MVANVRFRIVPVQDDYSIDPTALAALIQVHTQLHRQGERARERERQTHTRTQTDPHTHRHT
jgi:hypothetical protein